MRKDQKQAIKAEESQDTAAAVGTGALAGGATGAVVGGVAGGPIGAAVGAAIGGVAGAATGGLVDYSAAEPEFRRDWESGPYREITTWEQAEPAYRYGWSSYEREDIPRGSYDEARPLLKSQWHHQGKFEDMEPMVRTAWDRRASARMAGGGETRVPVVEEEMKVGKRKVETGGVRVETRVTETPVEEKVRLHEEKVHVERRPVDRPLTEGDAAAFREGTIELRETAEEAVAQKRPRVVEEVVIRKEGQDRTETVRDTVRRTDVDVRRDDSARVVSESVDDALDTEFRSDHGTRFAGADYTYDQVRPAYRYGRDLARDGRYSGDWTTVEPEARRRWEERNAGTWDQFKDSVRHAWEKTLGRA